MTGRPRDPRRDAAGRPLVVPFVGAGLAGMAAMAVLPGPPATSALAVGAVLMLLLVTACLALSWHRWPPSWQAVPVFASFLVILMARDGAGGTGSGFGALSLLPVTWLALYGTGRLAVAGIAVTGAVFIGPVVLIGAPTYDAVDGRRAAVFMVCLALVAYVVRRMVVDLNAGRVYAELLTAEVTASRANLAAVAAVARRLGAGEDVRSAVVEGAVSVAGADVAILFEHDGAGTLVQRAGVGLEAAELHLPLGQRSGAAKAFVDRQSFFVADAPNDPRVSRGLIRATGVRSALFVPLELGGELLGVLTVAWRSPIDEADTRLDAVRLLAVEAAIALQRSDSTTALRRAATEDPVTGAANRRSLDMVLAAELPVSAMSPRALLMLDLDHFKAYNDTFGHPAGDALLRAAVVAWRMELREHDLIARYGGEEFCVLLRDCPPARVAVVAERLRQSCPSGETVSIGVVTARWGESPEALLERADAALYRAKDNGRNIVEVELV